MPEYAGLPKDAHEKLTRAVTMYRNLTGEAIDISGIPVAQPAEENPEAVQAKAKADLERRAEVTRKMENAQQDARRQAATAR